MSTHITIVLGYAAGFTLAAVLTTIALFQRWKISRTWLTLSLALSFLLAPCQNAAASQAPTSRDLLTIQRIIFKGSRRFQEKELLAISGLKKGGAYSQQELQESANRLSNLGIFAQVGFRFSSDWIEFDLRDNDHLLPPYFENIVWLSDEELLAGLKERLPAFTGSVPDSGSLAEDVARQIEALLAEKGIKATVQEMPFMKPGQPVSAIHYSVTEPQIHIEKFVFGGSQTGITEELQRAMAEKIGGDYSRIATASWAETMLLPVYERRGYIRARFGDAGVTVLSTSSSAAKVEVRFPVTEGAQYSIGKLRMKDDDPISRKAAAKLDQFKPGQTVNMEELKKTLATLGSDYLAQGYMKATVRASPAFDDTAHTVSYEVELLPGLRYHLRNLDIHGLDEAQLAKLREVWKLNPGDVYDPTYAPSFVAKYGMKLRFLNGAGLAWTQKLFDDVQQADLILFFRKPGERGN